ncbi:tryptophan synthase subunit beta [Dickeya dadantii]|nr:tryptophan synthase subunit beta [Dickeya dadantii]MCA7014536.1 tryptophan synthase subunit beta [Dickeya dadantii]MCL6407094.1 tryptophan synthase subunit beta [Dickeya dadantii]NAT76511.1 tryptophan synthase subunit beta [Dickeya dadantii]NPE51074.1 tryptophan synthase subunit beta [Dickeya dadantii]NPE56801.1 tryptophan synthase subunit beta [Dickeya dadantii]
MFYILRDSNGHLIRVEETPFPEMNGELPDGSVEAMAWLNNQQAILANIERLRSSDLEMVRVLEDLIQVLITKGQINITDFPAAAQLKLINRAQAREALGDLDSLIREDEDKIF